MTRLLSHLLKERRLYKYIYHILNIYILTHSSDPTLMLHHVMNDVTQIYHKSQMWGSGTFILI